MENFLCGRARDSYLFPGPWKLKPTVSKKNASWLSRSSECYQKWKGKSLSAGNLEFKKSFTTHFLLKGHLDLKETQIIQESEQISWELGIFGSQPSSCFEFLTLNNVPVWITPNINTYWLYNDRTVFTKAFKMETKSLCFPIVKI